MENIDNLYVKLAKETIAEYALAGTIKKVSQPLAPELQKKAGVFVSIKKGGHLRGCIGTFEPSKENIAEEIIANAISAANYDPRFPAIKAEELKEIDISVDVLTKPIEVKDIEELDPKKYGIIVEKGRNKGLLLPDLEGVETVAKQLAIAKSKAGINGDEGIKIYKFEVNRYK